MIDEVCFQCVDLSSGGLDITCLILIKTSTPIPKNSKCQMGKGFPP